MLCNKLDLSDTGASLIIAVCMAVSGAVHTCLCACGTLTHLWLELSYSELRVGASSHSRTSADSVLAACGKLYSEAAPTLMETVETGVKCIWIDSD